MKSRSNRRSLYEYDQPFDLFEEFEKGSQHHMSHPKTVIKSSHSKSKFWIAGGAFIAAVIALFVGLGLYNQQPVHKPFVLLELRAISESGHPVAGADVRIQDKKLGVTDSFGEWRRYCQSLSQARNLIFK